MVESEFGGNRMKTWVHHALLPLCRLVSVIFMTSHEFDINLHDKLFPDYRPCVNWLGCYHGGKRWSLRSLSNNFMLEIYRDVLIHIQYNDGNLP